MKGELGSHLHIYNYIIISLLILNDLPEEMKRALGLYIHNYNYI